MQYVPFVRSDRIHLREVRLTDVNDRYYAWLNDPEINRFLETRFVPRSLENIAGFVGSHDGKGDEPFFAVCLNDGGRHIGNIKLGPINWYHRHADVSLLIGEKDLWGQGYASEAIAALCAFAFKTLALSKLKAGAYATNQGSIRAFEKVGFKREGLLRSHYHSEGAYVDGVLLGLLASEYQGGGAS